jgi:hypothetical protein
VWAIIIGFLLIVVGGLAAVRPDAVATLLQVDPAGRATTSLRVLGATVMVVGFIVLIA